MRFMIAAGVMAFACSAACAQTPPATPMPMESGKPNANCAAIDVKLDAPYASWAAKGTAASARGAADLAKAQLPIGKAVEAQLLPTPEVNFPTQPEKPGGSVSKGGLFQVKIETAGVYFVALGGGAWIDLIDKDGKASESVAHQPGVTCTTIRKMVDFKLAPGSYTLQVSAYNQEKLAVLVGKRS